MSRFIETIRIENGQPCNLDWHQRRFDATRKTFFGELPPLVLEDLIFKNFKKKEEDITQKCRIVFDRRIRSIEFQPYEPRPIRSVALVEGDDLRYDFKFFDRRIFEKLKKQAPRADEIIIVRDGFLTDTSYSNLVFFDGKNWWTPDTFLLNGTQRQFLLKNGLLREQPIRASDLPEFQFFKFINAMLDLESSPALPIEFVK